MTKHSLTAAVAAAALAMLFSCAAPQSASADSNKASSSKELALKVKGWDCDG